MAEGDYYSKSMYLIFFFVGSVLRGSFSNIRDLENILPGDFKFIQILIFL